MTNSPRDSASGVPQAWVLRSRALLESSAQAIDGATLSRLNRARQAALDSLESAPRRDRAVLRWLGAGAIAAGVALVLWQGLLPVPPGPMSAAAVVPLAEESVPAPPAIADSPVTAPDFELLSDAERYALLQELEFYAWLETTAASEDQGG